MKARGGQTWWLWVLWGAVLACPTPAAGKLLAYVANLWGSSVSVIDTDSNTVVETLPLADCAGPINQGCGVGAIAMRADGSRGYVTLGYPVGLPAGAVTVLDARTRTFTARIPVGQNPDDIVLTPDGTRAYVSNLNDRTISVIDLQREAVIATIAIGYDVLAIAISPDGRYVYAPESDAGQVAVIDTTTNTLMGAIDVGRG